MQTLYCRIKSDNLVANEKKAVNRMNSLRGLFALLIVLGHASMAFEHELFPLWIIHKFNMVSVCFFFVVSGWSLSYNFHNREAYLKGFIYNKVFKIFVFATICEIIGKCLNTLFFSEPIAINVKLFFEYNWYIYEIIAFYIIFYVIYRFAAASGRETRAMLIAVCSLIISLVCWYCSNHYKAFWIHSFHFSSLCFWWGIMLHEYYDILKKAVKRPLVFSLLLLGLGAASCVCLKMPQGDLFRRK